MVAAYSVTCRFLLRPPRGRGGLWRQGALQLGPGMRWGEGRAGASVEELDGKRWLFKK